MHLCFAFVIQVYVYGLRLVQRFRFRHIPGEILSASMMRLRSNADVVAHQTASAVIAMFV